MLSQTKRRELRQLERKSVRDSECQFVAEGVKTVGDLLRGGLRCRYLAGTEAALSSLPPLPGWLPVDVCTADEIGEAGTLRTRNELIGIFHKPTDEGAAGAVVVALDEVQDPGNLGSIVRSCDWFGVRRVVLGVTCADPYGPKAVQSSRGALARVRCATRPLEEYLSEARSAEGRPVLGTLLEGRPMGEVQRPGRCVLLMGNEGRGLSPELRPYVDVPMLIPPHPAGAVTSESLNVAVATGIALAWLRGL